MQKDYHHKSIVLTSGGLIAAATTAAVAGALYRLHRCRPKPSGGDDHLDRLIPRLDRTESGRVGRIEPFSHYVVRQMGFEDAKGCPRMCKLADSYLKRSHGSEDEQSIYEYFANEGTEAAEFIYGKLVEELDRCIFSYFAFHWSHVSSLISQVLTADCEHGKNLKELVMAATRKQRFEKVVSNLKVTRVFATLVEEIKAIGGGRGGDSPSTDVMVRVTHDDRSPVLLLMGGGMGAGKSTVLKDILKQPFWSGAAANAVVVEADAFKETDVVYRALSSGNRHQDMLHSAELVHQSSTDAASSLLVTALNEGRDVIMDGTLSWEPFVEQTISMARNVHRRRYRMGVGYKVASDGTVTENYWEQIAEDDEGQQQQHEEGSKTKNPYRIELVGVVCDAYLAVVRGIRRGIMMGRAVRVRSQLLSHKRFACAFPRYCDLVDNARIYCTNAVCGPLQLIGWKDGDSRKLLVDPDDKCVDMLRDLNEDAESVLELYGNKHAAGLKSGSVWEQIVLGNSRTSLQLELKMAIQKIETPPSQSQPKQTCLQAH